MVMSSYLIHISYPTAVPLVVRDTLEAQAHPSRANSLCKEPGGRAASAFQKVACNAMHGIREMSPLMPKIDGGSWCEAAIEPVDHLQSLLNPGIPASCVQQIERLKYGKY